MRVTSRPLAQHFDGRACAARCGAPLAAGDPVLIEEYAGRYLNDDRFAIWHRNCHPTVVDRLIKRLANRVRRTGSSFGGR